MKALASHKVLENDKFRTKEKHGCAAHNEVDGVNCSTQDFILIMMLLIVVIHPQKY